MKKSLIMTLLFVCCFASLAVAQTSPTQAPAATPMQSASVNASPDDPVTEAVFQSPKPGSQEQYEAGRKKHMAWHGSQGDKWAWHTWEVLTGPGTGNYNTFTSGHNWTDFQGREKFEDADNADAGANIGPHAQSTVVAYYALRRDLSLNPDESASPYLQVQIFVLKPEAARDFVEAVKRVGEGVRKSMPGVNSRWYQLVNGGESPQFVLVTPRKSIAELRPFDVDAAVAKAYGAAQGARLMRTLRNSVQKLETELLRYRADLSYVPGAK
jgi:hypothetical protein